MAMSILVTGGARSGKSAIAETLAMRLSETPVYIATAEAGDAEMSARISAHRERRGPGWRTVEAPLDLVSALDESDDEVRLVDCLTLWLSNLFHADRNWREETEALRDAIARQRGPVVLVTNEVGGGIVPENALARAFRDAAGWMNQSVAGVCDEVYLAVAGCPLRVKPYDELR